MALFNALTSEQRQIIRACMQMTRVRQGQLARIMNDLQELKGVYDASVAPVVALLDPGALINDNSDLAGATVVAKEDLEGVMAEFGSILTDHNTTPKRAVMTKFAGIPNVVGSI